MGTNFNPVGLKTFAEMGFTPQYINNTQGTAQTPAIQTPQIQASSPQTTSIQAPAPQVVQTQTNQNTSLEKSPKKDTVTIAGKEIGKKKAVITGLGIALAIAGACFLAFGKGKNVMPPEVKQAYASAKNFGLRAEGALQDGIKLKREGIEISKKAGETSAEADKLKEEAQAKLRYIIESFKEAKNNAPDSDIIRKIDTDSKSGDTTMREFTPDGKFLTRLSVFSNDDTFPRYVEEWIPGGNRGNIMRITRDGKISLYEEGVERITERHLKKTRVLELEGGKISKFMSGIETKKDSSGKTIEEKINRILELTGNNIKAYQEGHEKTADGVEKIRHHLEYKNGHLFTYKAGVEVKDTTIKIDKKFNYKENKYHLNYKADFAEMTEQRDEILTISEDNVRKYETGVVSKQNKPVNTECSAEYKDGNIASYTNNTTVTEAGTTRSEFQMDFREGKPVSYREGVEAGLDNSTTYEKEILLQNGKWVQTVMQNPESQAA